MTLDWYANRLERLYQREQTLRQYSKDTQKNRREIWDCIVAQYKLNLRYFKLCRRSGELVNLPDVFEDRMMMIRHSIKQRNSYGR